MNKAEVLKTFIVSDTKLHAFRAYKEMLRLKNYSSNTIKNYCSWFLYFLKYFPSQKPSTITKNEILDFMVWFRSTKNWSPTTQNQLINAIKFFFEKLLNRPAGLYELPRAQKEYKLPSVFA